MQFSFKLNPESQRFLSKFKRLPNDLQTAIATGLERGLLLTEDIIRLNSGVKFRRGGAGLSGRLTSYVSRKNGGIVAGVGFRKTKVFPYELSQEFGAKAKGGGAMAIPISGEAKAASNRGQGPRSFGDRLAMIKSGGRIWLIESTNRVTKFHWLLVKSIPPRLKFRENAEKGIPLIDREVTNELTKALS